MMHKTLRTAAMAVAIAGGLAAIAQPASASTVLNFNDLAGPAGGGVPSYTSQGFKITSSSAAGFLLMSTGHPYNANPGGATLTHVMVNMNSIFERTDGGLFDFLSIDVSDYYNSASPIDLVFTFTDALGAITSETIKTDNLRGLQTLAFNRQNLSRFTMNSPTNWVQFDNIMLDTVSAVPEPGTWAMMLIGFFTVGGALRTSRRSAQAAAA
jgi:hypothetical protein